MTDNKKAIELCMNLASNLTFNYDREKEIPILLQTKGNDLLLKHMERIGNFNFETDADEWGLILMAAALNAKTREVMEILKSRQ